MVPRSAVFALILAALLVGCTSADPIDVPHAAVDGGGNGGAGGAGGGTGAGPGDAAVSDAKDVDVPDAPVVPVLMGIAPSPHFEPGTAPTQAAQLEAQLDTIAVGSRGVPMVRRWDALFVDGATPVMAEWQRLEGTAALYSKAGRGMLLCLAIVDRQLDARPAALGLGWDTPVSMTAVESLIDRAFNTVSSINGELPFLALGTEVDRYLAVVSSAERAGLTKLLLHALSYAKSHPGRPADTKVGITFTADALMSPPTAEMTALMAASDVVMATYVPLDVDFDARPPSAVAGDLDALALSAPDAAKSLPIVLQEVGYPSDAMNQSSDEQQKTFFTNLVQALSTRRARHPFVGIAALHDAEPGVCQAEATALGQPASAKLISARCSLGLKAGSGEAKPAYATAKDALATFATP
jgi:hypothetical protein